MAYGTISDKYSYESAALRNRAPTVKSTDDQQARMGVRATESVEPQGYLSRAGDLIGSVTQTCHSIFSRSAVLMPFHWMIENRFGLAKIAGIPMVPSQVLPWLCKNRPAMFPPDFPKFPDLQESREIVNKACKFKNINDFQTEPLQIKQASGILHGVICYPPDWDQNNSQCILYNNPNGVVLTQLLDMGYLDPESVPGLIQSKKKCPVILYDYRGTGINKSEGRLGNLPFSTYETVVQDGLAALECALDRFEHVYVAGSSLGGGVATASLARHLEARGGADDSRVELLTHDSFTTTPRVLMPERPVLADFLGWLVGGKLDAETPMRELVKRRVSVIALNNRYDGVIPKGARMSEFLQSLYGEGREGGPDGGRVVAKEFYGYDHTVLTPEMARYL